MQAVRKRDGISYMSLERKRLTLHLAYYVLTKSEISA